MKGEQGDLQRSEGEGGRSRATEAGRRGRPEEREGERPYGEQRGVVQQGGSDLVRAGEIFFSCLLVGPRITNPIRTSPPG